MWKNWLTLSSSDSPEIAFTFVKATRTKREEDERSPGKEFMKAITDMEYKQPEPVPYELKHVPQYVQLKLAL